MNRTQTGLLRRTWAAACAMALAASLSAVAQENVPSPYRRLRDDQLIKQLSRLGMVDLLAAMEERIPPGDTSAKAVGLRGRIRVGRALAMSDEKVRNGLLDEAIPLLRQAVKLGEKDPKLTPPQTLEYFRHTLELAVAMGLHRVTNPHLLRLRHLQGSDQDRKVIRTFTKEAVEIMDYLKDDIADTLTDWRSNMEWVMLYVPRLEDIQSEVVYNAGWIRLTRARVLNDGGEKTQLCRDIVAEMRKFAGDPLGGRKHWALFATGVAHRLTKQYDRAEKLLNQAAVPEARSVDLRSRAWFERARNRIEEGDPQKADKAIQEYEQGAAFVFGQGQQAKVDLRLVFLRNYMYGLRADKLEALALKEKPGSAKQKQLRRQVRALRAKAQDTLLWFIERYADRPDLVRAFLDIVATKFANVKDLDKASAVVLLARAYSKIDSKDDNELADAEDLLRRVLVHKDMQNPKVAQAIRPGAMWELGHRMNKRRRNSEAATYFVLLARLYPQHRLAFRSAKFAVLSLWGVVNERRQKSKLLETNVRLEFVRAIGTLLAGWAKEEDAVKWNYDLGLHCAKMADMSEDEAVKFYWQGRAIAAYEGVPASLREYMESQHTALGLRTAVVLNRGDLARQFEEQKLKANAEVKRLAAQVLSYEQVDVRAALAAIGRPLATTAPAAGGGNLPAPEKLAERTEALAKELNESLKVYSAPGALITRLKAYSGDAAQEIAKVQRQIGALPEKEKKLWQDHIAGLKDWAAEAEFQAAVIKYEELTQGMKPPDRERTEKEALQDIREVIRKWPDTAVRRTAYEFEIRKLIERGQTAEAIEKVRDFKGRYPEQAEQLIQLVVQQIKVRIDRLRKRIKKAVTQQDLAQYRSDLQRYQVAYASFAEDLYQASEALPVDLAALDAKVKDAEDLEKRGEFDALRALAGEYAALVETHEAKMQEIKAAPVLERVMGDAAGAGDPAAKREILPNLAAAYINAVVALRDVVGERYALRQMYADALLQKGEALKAARQTIESKGTYQNALALFEASYGVDQARRKVQADWLEKEFRPIIDAIQPKAKNRDQVRRLIDQFRADLVARGQDPNESVDVSTLEFSYRVLKRARTQADERRHLPRPVALLVRGWENHLRRLKTRVTVDHLNVIGLARAYRGLGQYDKAMEYYRRYTDGIDKSRFPKVYWRAQLERCQCHFEGYADSAEAMKNLVIHINMLQLEDKTMGGLGGGFEAIRREALKIAAKSKARKVNVHK